MIWMLKNEDYVNQYLEEYFEELSSFIKNPGLTDHLDQMKMIQRTI